jgi:uncharacterized protein YjhX (UPF0386 family)
VPCNKKPNLLTKSITVMKKLNVKRLIEIKGGGCYKWIRRHNREARGNADEDLMDSLIDAFDRCINDKYDY